MIIPPIIINTTDIMSQFTSLTREDVETMLDNIAKGLTATYANLLEEAAQDQLHKTRDRYIANIRVIDSGKMEGTVMLDYSKDRMVQMIEEGQEPFDIKAGLLKSSKVKFTKNGVAYITVPMRWGTPGALAESSAFVGKMPSGIYQAAKKLEPTIPVSGGGKRSAGLKISEIPEQFRIAKVRPAPVDSKGNSQWKAYEHKSSVYKGIAKQQDGVTGQNKYNSFRRVSENSDPDAWIHPGIKRYGLMQVALNNFNIPTVVGEQIDNALSQLGLI